MPFKHRKKSKALTFFLLGLLAIVSIALSQCANGSRLLETTVPGAAPEETQRPTGSSLSNSQTTLANYKPHFDISDDFQEYAVDLERGDLVSIAPLSDTAYFVCNYGSIYLISKEQNSFSLKEIEKPKDAGFWNPTGLFFDISSQTLYVANYNGHNVLKMGYDPAQQTLSLQQTIIHADMVSPENVYVYESSGDILAADYDGSAIFRFAPDGSLKWRRELGQAHGITAKITDQGEAIYATSLVDRSVVKLNNNGEIVATTGKLGSAVGEYVWPVTVTALQSGNLAITDTQAGRITILDDNLKVVEALGANGPGVDLMNYPYALAQLSSGELLLADTFKARLMKLTANWLATEQILFQFGIEGDRLTPVLGTAESPYTYPSFPAIDVLKQLGIDNHYSAGIAQGGFNSLDYDFDPEPFHKEIELDYPGSKAYTVSDNYWYSTWAKVVPIRGRENVLLIGSPQSPHTLVVDPLTGAWSRAKVLLSSFPDDGGVRSPDGTKINLRQLVAPAVEKFTSLNTLLKSGKSRTEAYAEIFAADIDDYVVDDTKKDIWEAILTATEPAQTFYNSYSAAPKNVQVLASTYFAQTLPQKYSYLFEMLAINYLAGGRSFELSQADENVSLQTPLRFYPGYELEKALATDYKTGIYASALENQPSYSFEIDLRQAKKTLTLRFDWLDGDNYPTDYRIDFLDNRQNLISATTVNNNSQVSNSLSMSAEQKVRFARVTIDKFKGEQRLLLKNLDVFVGG